MVLSHDKLMTGDAQVRRLMIWATMTDYAVSVRCMSSSSLDSKHLMSFSYEKVLKMPIFTVQLRRS